MFFSIDSDVPDDAEFNLTVDYSTDDSFENMRDADRDTIPEGQTASFTIGLFGVDCDEFLLGGSGFTATGS